MTAIDAATAERREAEAVAEAQKKKTELEATVHRLEVAAASPRPAPTVADYRFPNAYHANGAVQSWLQSNTQAPHIWKCGVSVPYARRMAEAFAKGPLFAGSGHRLAAEAKGQSNGAYVLLRKLSPSANSNAAAIIEYDKNLKQLEQTRSELDVVVDSMRPKMTPFDVRAAHAGAPMAPRREGLSTSADAAQTSAWLKHVCCAGTLDEALVKKVAANAMVEGVDASVLISMSTDEVSEVLFSEISVADDDAKTQLLVALTARAVLIGVQYGVSTRDGKASKALPGTSELFDWLGQAVGGDNPDLALQASTKPAAVADESFVDGSSRPVNIGDTINIKWEGWTSAFKCLVDAGDKHSPMYVKSADGRCAVHKI